MNKKCVLVNWFEIPVKDLQRAKSFYQQVFDVDLFEIDFNEVNKDSEKGKMALFPLPQKEKEDVGIPGALVASKHYVPSDQGCVVYFSCKDLSLEASKVEEHGGKVVLPKKYIGEHGYVAHFIDTEGNRIGLHSMT